MTTDLKLFIGGASLGCHPGWIPSQGEFLADLLQEHLSEVVVRSSNLHPLRRLTEILTELWRRRRAIDVAVFPVFSGSGFRVPELAGALASRLRIKHVLWLHGGELPSFASGRRRRVQRVLSRAEAIIVPSPYLGRLCDELGAPCQIIPNGIRLPEYEYRERPAPVPRLLWLRTFHEIYNPELALKALKGIQQTHPKASMTLAGQDKGSLAATRQAAKAGDLGEVVSFPGFLEGAAKRRAFAEHDVFLNTNHIDNMPVTLLEAAASGLPIVSTNVGGIPDLLQDEKNALLVPDNDAEAMAQGVRRVLDQPGLSESLATAAREVAVASDVGIVRSQWLDMLSAVCRPGHGDAG